jgi:hypothetical protein
MRILDGGKKDFYDYLAGIYGIDNDVVYDRAKSHVFRPMEAGDTYFCKTRLYNDRCKKETKGRHYVNGKYVYGIFYEGLKLHFVIEIGFTQYLFMVERYLDNNLEVQLEPQLLNKFQVDKKQSQVPVSLIPVDFWGLFSEAPSIRRYYLNEEIQNPIFTGTWVTSFLNAEEVYNEIYNYLISIKEPKIIDNRNDVQKLESKGFDKKTSFRNPVINANSKKKK